MMAGAAAKAMEPQRDKASGPLRAVSAVLGAFIGIRKNSARDRDLASVKPAHIVIAGVIAAVVFVLAIVTLVRFITS